MCVKYVYVASILQHVNPNDNTDVRVLEYRSIDLMILLTSAVFRLIDLAGVRTQYCNKIRSVNILSCKCAYEY